MASITAITAPGSGSGPSGGKPHSARSWRTCAAVNRSSDTPGRRGVEAPLVQERAAAVRRQGDQFTA
jgi:hypothetical protein